MFDSSFCLTVHANYPTSNNGNTRWISGKKEMTPNVKEHAYLIKNRDNKRGCDRDDDPLMVYWDIQYVLYEKTKPIQRTISMSPCSRGGYLMFQLLCLSILFESSVTLLPPLKTTSSISRNKGIERFLTALAKSGGFFWDDLNNILQSLFVRKHRHLLHHGLLHSGYEDAAGDPVGGQHTHKDILPGHSDQEAPGHSSGQVSSSVCWSSWWASWRRWSWGWTQEEEGCQEGWWTRRGASGGRSSLQDQRYSNWG